MNISFLNALIFVAYIPRFYTLTVITDIVSIPIYRTFVGQYQSSGIDLREVVHQVYVVEGEKLSGCGCVHGVTVD